MIFVHMQTLYVAKEGGKVWEIVMLNLWKWQIMGGGGGELGGKQLKSEKYTWRKMKSERERKEKWKQIYSPTKNISYCTYPYCKHTHTHIICIFILTQSIANSLLLWLYIIPYVIMECVTSCAIQAKMSLRLSFLLLLAWYVQRDVRKTPLKGLWRSGEKKRGGRRNKKKVFVDVIYFRLLAAKGFQVLFYMLKLWAALYFL